MATRPLRGAYRLFKVYTTNNPNCTNLFYHLMHFFVVLAEPDLFHVKQPFRTSGKKLG